MRNVIKKNKKKKKIQKNLTNRKAINNFMETYRLSAANHTTKNQPKHTPNLHPGEGQKVIGNKLKIWNCFYDFQFNIFSSISFSYSQKYILYGIYI